MNEWILAEDDPLRPDVVSLLERHLVFARRVTPSEDVHALDLDGLRDETVVFFSIRENGALLGIGAVKTLDDSHMELKSIHTVAEARGRGVGRTMVDHLVSVARSRGATRVSLETGSMAEFAPSRALYTRAGFVECEPFGDYSRSRNSKFMTLDLH